MRRPFHASPALQKTDDPSAPGAHTAVYISGGIGDAVLHMSHVRSLAQQIGQPLILLLPQHEATHGLFASQPYIAKVVALREIQHDRAHRVTRLADLLQQLKIDTLFLFSFQRFVAQAAKHANIPRRVGFIRYHQPHLARLLTHRGWVKRRGTPHPDTYTWLPPILRRCGLNGQPVFPSMEVPATDLAATATTLADSPRMIGIGLNGSTPDKRYDGTAFARVIRQLHTQDPRLSFLLFGASDVADVAAEIRSEVGDDVPMLDITTQQLDLTISHALLSRCIAFVGNDSMGLHLALAHCIPSIGLFGPTPPMYYVPWLHTLVSPRKGDMSGITPERIVDAMQDILQSLEPDSTK